MSSYGVRATVMKKQTSSADVDGLAAANILVSMRRACPPTPPPSPVTLDLSAALESDLAAAQREINELRHALSMYKSRYVDVSVINGMLVQNYRRVCEEYRVLCNMVRVRLQKL